MVVPLADMNALYVQSVATVPSLSVGRSEL